MQLSTVLKTYGLNEKQAKVYLACLGLGSAPVQSISQAAQLPRSTCYEILDQLKSISVISTFQKKKIKWFNAEDPRLLVRQTKDKLSILEDHIPKFLATYGTNKDRPGVRFYNGKEGMKNILEEVLNEASEILAFSSADDLFNVLGQEWPKFLKRRIKNKIPVKVIIRGTEKGLERQKLGPQELRDVRLIGTGIDFHGLILLWKNKIAMFSFQNNLTSLIIENVEFYAIQKAMFSLIWNQLPAYRDI